MLPHEEAHAHVAHVAHDVGQGVGRIKNPVPPGQFGVRYQEPKAAASADPGLKRHKHARGLAVAGDAFAVEEFDARDRAPANAHVLGQRPAREAFVEALPQGDIIAVMQPHGAVRGLEFYKG